MFAVNVPCGFQSTVLFLDAPGIKTKLVFVIFEKRETDCDCLLTYSISCCGVRVDRLSTGARNCLRLLRPFGCSMVNYIGATSVPSNQSIMNWLVAFLWATRNERIEGAENRNKKGKENERCTLGQLSIVRFHFFRFPCRIIATTVRTHLRSDCDACSVSKIVFIWLMYERMTTVLFNEWTWIWRRNFFWPKWMIENKTAVGHLQWWCVLFLLPMVNAIVTSNANP